MKRGLVLGLVIGIGSLSIGVSAAWQGQAQAPQNRTITVDKVRDNLFLLRGGGGNTAAFITTNGVVVVDAKNPGWGQPILDEIKKLTPKPVTTLINTHSHGDHVGGNVEFPASVEIIATDTTKSNMLKPEAKTDPKALPERTFKDKMTIGKGADQIDLFFFGPGHTGGDAWVSFPALHVVHAGDIFAGKGLPNTDAASGATILHYGETLNKAYNSIKNVETVINGHSTTTTTWADLKTFAEFNDDFVKWAQAEMKNGRTPEQATAEWKVPEKYVGYSANVPTLFGGMAGKFELLRSEMKK